MPLPQITSNRLLVARGNLERFVTEEARRTQAEHGLGYVPCVGAPSSYPALVTVYRRCQESREPLPVSSAHCAATIFSSPGVNWAFRFVHDIEHVSRELTFSFDDELDLGCYHLERLREVGYTVDSYEHKLLYADTIGQTYCSTLLGRFPHDQLRFDYDCVAYGVDWAVELESRRTLPPAA